jgi:hypothetical protein
MRTALLFLAAVALAHADPVVAPVGRLTLLDGRVLKNVVIRSFDAPSSKVLVLADGRALLIPITLIPPPYAEALKAATAKPDADLVQSTPVPPPATAPGKTAVPETPASPPAPAPATPPKAAPAVAALPEVDPVEQHMAVASAHVRRYYKYEYRPASSSIAVTDSDIEVDETEPVTGWTNRYRTTGKIYLEVYDSVGGGSFRRRVTRFEVLTEQKPGERIKVIDFTRK